MYSETFIRSCSVTAAYYTYVKNKCTNYTYTVCGDYTYTESSHSDTPGYYESHTDRSSCNDCYECPDGNVTYGDTHLDTPLHTDSPGYYNHTDYDDSYYNYYGGSSSRYANCTDQCSVKWEYGNYADCRHDNREANIKKNVTWSSKWNSGKPGGESINDSVEALKEIYENIEYLLKNKGKNLVANNSINEFKKAVNTPRQVIESNHYNNIKDSLDKLFQDITHTSSGVSGKGKSDIIYGNDFSIIKTKIDSLRDMDARYGNYFDAGYANSSANSYNSQYINSVMGPTSGGPYTDKTEVKTK